MTRWIMIGLTLLGLIIAFLTRSPSLLGLAILMMIVGSFGTVFSIAADRISSNARPDSSMLPPEALVAIREKARTRAAQGSAQGQVEKSSAAAMGSGQS